MKRALAALIALSFIFAPAVAKERNLVRFGLLGGVTAPTNLKGYDINTADNFHAGVCVSLPIGSNIVIQPALEYLQNGLGASDGLKNESLIQKNIALPIGFQFGVQLLGVRPYILAEPYLSINLGYWSKGDNIPGIIDKIKTNADWGIGAGAGLEVFHHIQISARYVWNFGHVPTRASMPEMKWTKANGIQITAAILF